MEAVYMLLVLLVLPVLPVLSLALNLVWSMAPGGRRPPARRRRPPARRRHAGRCGWVAEDAGAYACLQAGSDEVTKKGR